jgi:hypothetical protein
MGEGRLGAWRQRPGGAEAQIAEALGGKCKPAEPTELLRRAPSIFRHERTPPRPFQSPNPGLDLALPVGDR